MKNSKLKEEYMKEESFWHVTNKKNLDSIREKGMVPKDGKRDGERIFKKIMSVIKSIFS